MFLCWHALPLSPSCPFGPASLGTGMHVPGSCTQRVTSSQNAGVQSHNSCRKQSFLQGKYLSLVGFLFLSYMASDLLPYRVPHSGYDGIGVPNASLGCHSDGDQRGCLTSAELFKVSRRYPQRAPPRGACCQQLRALGPAWGLETCRSCSLQDIGPWSPLKSGKGPEWCRMSRACSRRDRGGDVQLARAVGRRGTTRFALLCDSLEIRRANSTLNLLCWKQPGKMLAFKTLVS